MNKEEFKTLVDNSGMNKADIAKILGVARGTIYNYLKGETIPENKVEFIREVLSKDKNSLKNLLGDDKGLTVENTLEFVVKNFDQYMSHPEFNNKVLIKSFKIADHIIREEREKLSKA